jgi:hypothetical protein
MTNMRFFRESEMKTTTMTPRRLAHGESSVQYVSVLCRTNDKKF